MTIYLKKLLSLQSYLYQMLDQEALLEKVLKYFSQIKRNITPDLRNDAAALVNAQNRKSPEEWKERLSRFLLKYLPVTGRQKFKEFIIKTLSYLQKIYPQIVSEYNSIIQKNLSINKIEDVEINSNQNQSIIYNFESQTQKRIQINLKNYKTYREFLQAQLYQIIDILQRKGGIVNYYNILMNQANLVDQNDHLAKLITSITFVDFIITLLKISSPSTLIPVLLSQQLAPFPFLYSVKGKVVNNQLIINEVLGVKNYPVIINIWSEEAAQSANNLYNSQLSKNQQKIYFSQVMNISPKCFLGSSFESNINIFKLNLVPNLKNSQVLLIHLVNYLNEDPVSISRKQLIINNLLPIASLVIIHADDKMLMIDQSTDKKNQAKDSPAIWNRYEFLFKNSIKKIYINQLASDSILEDSLLILKSHDSSFIGQDLFRFQVQADGDLIGHQNRLKQKKRLSNFLQALLKDPLKSQANFKSFLIEKTDIKSQIQQREQQIRNFLKDQFANAQKNQRYYKTDFLPKYVASRQLNEERIKMNDMTFEQYLRDMQQIKTQVVLTKQQHKENYLKIIKSSLETQENLKKILEQKTLSQFAQKCIQYIKSDDDITIRIFTQILTEQINLKINSQLLKLDNDIKQQDRKKSSSYQEQRIKIFEGRMTIDNIIQQISFYNELMIDRYVEAEDSYQQRYINNYYSKCLNNLYPFSLVDGETSNFGNEGLRRFFKSLNQKFDRKKIFVVSVIGSRASGKTTLLNTLFRYNLYLREDPYAKGIYMGLCEINTVQSKKKQDQYQMNNKLIIVLDTDGIMSMDITVTDLVINSELVRKNYAAFDHQVASILMSQSDLTIFSSEIKKKDEKKKQEVIPDQLSLTIAICYKVLDAFYSNNYKTTQIIPKNIIITFQGQPEKNISKKSIIENLIQKVTPILQVSLVNTPRQNKKLSINEFQQLFAKYIRLQEQNIFFLPSTEKKTQFQIFKSANQEYGVNVLSIRNRVMAILQSLQKYGLYPNTVIEYFNDSRVSWQILLMTGKKIVQVTTISQSEQKSRLYYAYRQQYNDIYETMSATLDKRYDMQQGQNKLSINNSQLLAKIQDVYKIWTSKEPQKSLHDIWGYFEQFLLNSYLQGFQTNEKNKAILSQDIINLGFKEFLKQASKYSQKIQWVNQYKLKIQKLLNYFMYKKIMRYFENFQEQFTNQRLEYFRKSAQAVLLNYTTHTTKSKRLQLKVELLTNCGQLMNKVLSRQVDMSKIEQNLTSTFKIIFQSENIFLKELQINSIKDCTDFEKSINNEYLFFLNKFILFSDEDQVPQKVKGQLSQIILKNLDDFSLAIKNHWKNTRVTNMDIKNLFTYIKDNIIDRITQETADKVREASKTLYDNQQNQNSYQLLRGQISNAIQQMTMKANKFPQKKEKFNNQNSYLTVILNRLSTIFQGKIILNKINFKIILLSRLFNLLLSIFFEQENKQILNLHSQFSKRIKKISDDVDKTVQETLNTQLTTKVSQGIKSFQASLMDKLKTQSKALYLSRINNITNKYYSSIVKVQQQILNETFENVNLTLTQPNALTIKAVYIQCYKFLTNPTQYIFSGYKNLFISQEAIKVDYGKVLAEKAKYLSGINNYSPDQFKSFLQTNFNQLTILINDEVFPQSQIKIKLLLDLKPLIDKFNKPDQRQKMINQVDFSQDFATMETTLKKKKAQLIGCTNFCPFCGAKCMEQVDHPGSHRAYRHFILAFGGCRDHNNTFLIQNCLSKSMINNLWTTQETKNKNKLALDYFQFATNNFQNWKSDIPSPYTAEQKPVNPTHIQIWANIQEAIISRWKQKFPSFKIRPSLNQQIIEEQRKQNFVRRQDVYNWDNPTNA